MELHIRSIESGAPASVRTPEVTDFLNKESRRLLIPRLNEEIAAQLTDPTALDQAYEDFWRTEADARYDGTARARLGYLAVKVA